MMSLTMQNFAIDSIIFCNRLQKMRDTRCSDHSDGGRCCDVFCFVQCSGCPVCVFGSLCVESWGVAVAKHKGATAATWDCLLFVHGKNVCLQGDLLSAYFFLRKRFCVCIRGTNVLLPSSPASVDFSAAMTV